MERDKGIEPSPRPWQGRVLPLYESRVRKTSRQAFIYSMAYGAGQDIAGVGCRTWRVRAPVASSVWHLMSTRLELDLQSSCGVVQNMAHSVAAKIRDRRSEFRMASLPKKVFISYVQED